MQLTLLGVGSCIGYYTQKAFILFLIYAELSITMSCVLNIISMVKISAVKK